MKYLFLLMMLFIMGFTHGQIISPYDPINVQLSKINYNGLGSNEVTEFLYNEKRKIINITQTQNGKLHATTNKFIYNSKGFLISYIKSYNLNNSPEITTIVYDSSTNKVKHIAINKIQNVVKHSFISSRDFKYYNDSIVVIDKVYILDTITNKMVFALNAFKNIISIKTYGEDGVLKQKILYTAYDSGRNPKKLVRGFVDGQIYSQANCLNTVFSEDEIINTNFEYVYKTISTYKPGGAKIPTQKAKTGFILKETQTKFDKDLGKENTIATIIYSYIGLK